MGTSTIEERLNARALELAQIIRRAREVFPELDVRIQISIANNIDLRIDEQSATYTSFNERFLVRRIRADTATAYRQLNAFTIDAISEALVNDESWQPLLSGTAVPKSRRSALDWRLHREMDDGENFEELATAIRENVLHEAERIEGLVDLKGRLTLWQSLTLVGSRMDLVGALQGALTSKVRINNRLGDQLTQVHSPESFLPIALHGARLWQRYGGLPEMGPDASVERLILHPRVAEEILRTVGIEAVQDYLAVGEGAVNCPGLYFIDDPSIEGLWTVRDFDDLGEPTFRQSLVVRGRSMTRKLRRDGIGQHWWQAAGVGQPRAGFSGILIGRGEIPLSEICSRYERVLMVNDVAVTRCDNRGTCFSAVITEGVLMQGERPIATVEPHQLRFKGSVFGSNGSVFGGAQLSRELQDTGSAVAPFISTTLELAPS